MKYSIIALAALIVAIANSAAGQGTAVPATAEAGSPAIAASRDAPPGLHQRNPRYRLEKVTASILILRCLLNSTRWWPCNRTVM